MGLPPGTRNDIRASSIEQAKAYKVGCGNVKTAEYVQLTALGFPHIIASETQEISSRIKMPFLGRFDLLALEKSALESAMEN